MVRHKKILSCIVRIIYNNEVHCGTVTNTRIQVNFLLIGIFSIHLFIARLYFTSKLQLQMYTNHHYVKLVSESISNYKLYIIL